MTPKDYKGKFVKIKRRVMMYKDDYSDKTDDVMIEFSHLQQNEICFISKCKIVYPDRTRFAIEIINSEAHTSYNFVQAGWLKDVIEIIE